MQDLAIELLTRDAFAPFGDVIETGAATKSFPINEGTAMRYHAIAEIDCAADGGRSVISLCRAQARELPLVVRMLERHPLGSQAFVPLSEHQRYLAIVAESPEATPRAFIASNGQGINYRRGTWHHPLIALQRSGDFLIIDRDGAGNNCEEVVLAQAWRLTL